MKNLFALTMVLVLAGPALAAESEDKPVTGLMHKFLDHMKNLRPFILSEKQINDPANEKKIQTELEGLSEAVKSAKHEPKLARPTFKVSREVLESHIFEIEKTFKAGNKNQTRWMLQSALSVCMSCHTQLPGGSKDFGDLAKFEPMTSSFDQAEFLFATRQFDSAFKLYDKTIAGYPKNKVTAENMEESIKRQVAYFARIKRDPNGGRDYLKKIIGIQTQMPDYTLKNVNAWMALFNEWSREKTPNMKTMTDDGLKKYVTQSMKPELWDKMVDASNPRVMTYLKISGLLYEYLNHHPKTKLMPEILYWLARCDRALNNNFFYSLADMYLKECIINYPKSAIALNCYQEYEDSVMLGYTGSSGVHVPQDVLEDLRKLKSKMGKPADSN